MTEQTAIAAGWTGDIVDAGYFDRKEYRRGYMKDWNASDEGKMSKRKYRHDKSKWVTDAQYLSRKFVAIDGEGLNDAFGNHLYVMLAISDKPSLIHRDGLRTRAILDYLFENLDPRDINVIYGGSYDFNCWVRDLLPDDVRTLYTSNYTKAPLAIFGYELRWIKGKNFVIKKGERSIVINDVVSFFQRPFIQACDEYLGKYEGRAMLVKEKARRGNFKIRELATINTYNQLELRLLVQLMNELRARLNRVYLRPRRWDGPGAIAAALFKREGVQEHRNTEIPDPVARAARFAYAGGRFEMIRYGAVHDKVYEYDVNSAYPAALIEVPSLAVGSWHHGRTDKDHDFALYKVKFTGSNPEIPGPLHYRAPNGTIAYPLNVENWIWTPEMRVLREYVKKVPGTKYTVQEVWYFTPGTHKKPFTFIRDLYDKRQDLKQAGDGAHVGIKLALNSMYGKTAQQVGWLPATRNHPVRVPAFHQIEWAGYVTSWCRARVLQAALTNINAVIAFETDAIFTTEPLNIQIDTGLGNFEMTEFDSLTYVQSGHYYGTSEGKEIVKCRGIDKGFVSREQVEALLTRPEHERVLDAKLTRFYGAGIALVRGLDQYWCKWLTEDKQLVLAPTGKRIHGGRCCDGGGDLALGYWHNTYCQVVGGTSSEYPVEWINPNPEMSELTELRESEMEWED